MCMSNGNTYMLSFTLISTKRLIAFMEKQVLSLEVNGESLYTLKVTCSSLILRIKLPLWTSIKALAVAKNGLPKIRGTYWSSSISKTTKSTGKINLSTLTSTSSKTPLGYAMDLSANCNVTCNVTLDGVGSLSPNFYKIDKDIKLILAPKSHNTLSKFMLPIVQGIVNSLDP